MERNKDMPGRVDPSGQSAKQHDSKLAIAETEIQILRHLCSEMYLVAGELGASEAVLDNLSAAANGETLPHVTLLPYHKQHHTG